MTDGIVLEDTAVDETVVENETENQVVKDSAVEGTIETVTADNYYQFERDTAMQIGDRFAVLTFAIGAVAGLHMVKLLVGRWFV